MRPRLAPLALVMAVLAAACGSDDDAEPEKARDLWRRIHDAGYRNFARAPGYETRKPTNAPHGKEVDIYVNAAVEKALATPGTTAFPDGSLIVKDGWDGATLVYVAVMEKQSGAWFWAEWEGDGTQKFSGSPSVCTSCHASGSDSVRAFSLPK